MTLTYPTMKLLHICFCVLIGTALSGCEIPMTAQDRIAVTRICEVLELKAQVAAAVWPGFDDQNAKAPDGMENLPVPTHAFIGGSSGNLKEIIEALKAKNPHIRIVINAISMETICEIKEILAAYDVKNEDIVQLQVSRSKQIGHYHLMQAENPVWICSFEF